MSMTNMTKEELARRRREDFDFMVLCQLKGNMSMYQLLRDRSIDDAVIEDKQELRISEDD